MKTFNCGLNDKWLRNSVFTQKNFKYKINEQMDGRTVDGWRDRHR